MRSTQFYRIHRGLPAQRAFTMVEVVLSLVVLMFMVLLVAAVLPISLRNSRYNSDFSQATTLLQHKINQLQDAGYANMTGPLLGSGGLAIIDGTPNTPSTNPLGAASATFEFTETDHLWEFFNGGMDSTGTRITTGNIPRGYLYIAPYSPSVYQNPVTCQDEYGLIRATVVVQWWTSKGNQQSLSATTLIPRAVVN